MRAADVKDTNVVNVIVVDPMPDAATQEQWRSWGMIQGDLIEAPDEVGPGFTYDGTNWTPPPPLPEPEIPEAT
jgi:hypothetical protein